MTDESVIKISIIKEIPFFGSRDSLESRLRNVSLRGFPHVRIYKDASFEFIHLSPHEIKSGLHTPQPNVYRTHIDKIRDLVSLFKKNGIDIMHLDKTYDFLAESGNGKLTEWTILPPVVEQFFIPDTEDGKFDYEKLIGDELREALKKEGLWLNPAALELDQTSMDCVYNLINDGSHRIHYGFENNGITVLRASNMTPGFPYYAVPQPYSRVKVVPERDQAAIETKIHVVKEPGHKNLYRLFPSGGIKSGDVRSEKVSK